MAAKLAGYNDQEVAPLPAEAGVNDRAKNRVQTKRIPWDFSQGICGVDGT